MSKKRVYELAKDLGLENRELISRLEKIGIAVKSHSSTLEDDDLERIQAELLAPEAREVVEKRIKSTVIRRRAVRMPVEESKPEELAAEPETEAPSDAPPPLADAVPAEVVRKTVPKEAPVRTSIYRDAPAGASVRKPVEPTAKTATLKPEAPAIERNAESEKKSGPETVSKAPEQQRKPLSVQPPESREIKRPPLEQEKKPQMPPEAPRPMPGGRKEFPRRADLKIVKDIGGAVPLPSRMEKSGRQPEAEKPRKKGGKPPVEVLMGEAPPRKKAFIKKLVDRKGRQIEVDREDRSSKWREEKKAAPVKMKKTLITTPKASKRRIRVDEAISVGELAKRMGTKASEVINKLMGMGLMVTINQAIDCDTATLIAADFGYQVEAAQNERDETMQRTEDSPENLKPRAPVVTIMGHVDHGKTSLLDAIRETNVIDGEAGGITQAIGAYHVHLKGRDIVFLDTPGHEAFTAMRARGAKVTDIVVLVVAADDGVMGQTVEAINHAQVAGVPIIVAINKMDKPGADPGKIRQALTEYKLLSEEWGGDTIFCEVSAKKKQGIEELLEMILLQADVMELKADPDRPARGVIIEAKLDRGRGPVATVLIQEGTLREGDAFVSRTEFGRVRAMINDQGKRISEAGPAMPVEVIGFSRVPQASSEFICVEDEKKARSIGEYWIRKERERELSVSSKITLEQLYQRMKEGVKELNVILKADVQGSVEALIDALNKLSTDDIKLKIIHSSTGTITETDVMLASASDAVIIGFNVRPDARVVEVAEQERVDIKLYDIIYNVIADVRAAMEGLLDPIFKEVVQGRAEVRVIFRVPKVGAIAGSYVTDGKITRSAGLRLLRDGVVVYEGRIASLRRFKDDAKEVAAGFECGIGIEGFNDIQVADVIEAYVKEQIERKL
ncbi:MAG: translation initiation factor IF-2 [Proteobacteria bacterium]|nr:translation initiation factor IF-2 [Pseudomonadota bacterium]MBU4582456.1 translation initiation factor IF-2 [Pseudomonadota bacterium]MCG2741034.1 translation initiation factor IF-2 [Syntrophaceae bacterium]